MVLEPPVTLFHVFLLGLSLGLTACAVTCLPFIGTWAFGRAGGAAEGVRDTAAFLVGRLLSYTALGCVAAILGAWFVKSLAEGVGNLAIGASGIVAAVWMVWPARGKACAARQLSDRLSPFLLGAGLTLIPCAPLAALMAASASAGDPVQGALCGLVFGLGTGVTPLVVMIPAAAGLGRAIRQNRVWLLPWIKYGAAATLAVLGFQRIALMAPGLAWLALLLGGLTVYWKRTPGRRRFREIRLTRA